MSEWGGKPEEVYQKRDNLLLEAKPIEVTEDPIPAGG